MDQSTSQASLEPLKKKRPTIITVSFISGFVLMIPFLSTLGISFKIMAADFFGSTTIYGGHPWLNPFIVFFGSIGLIGYWKMRKWGVYVYMVMSLTSIATMLTFGISTIYIHIFSLVVVGIGLANLKKMI